MESQGIYSGHLLVLAFHVWGHLRPLCAFSAKVVQERPDLAITFLIVGDWRKCVEREISRCFSDRKPDFGTAGSIRIVNIRNGPYTDPVAIQPSIFQAFPGFYDNLRNSKPVQCLETQTIFDAIRKPNSILIDFFFPKILQQIRSATGKSIPVFAWSTVSAAAAIRFMGPEEMGGYGDVESKARAQVEATGGKLEEAMYKLYHPLDGNVISLPGMPGMYDYEWFPQVPPPGDIGVRPFSKAYNFARDCDGFVSVSTAAYESESLDAMRSWLAETNRPLYAIGPLIPPGYGDASGLSSVAKQMEIDSSKNGDEVQNFLDMTLKRYGEHSLIYISFGSLIWPQKNEYVWILVDMLLQLDFPFILSHPSPVAVVPPGYVEKIKESGIGIISPWSPQQLILNHLVTGWFLTHCGQNSITEALTQGIPMIAWPLFSDEGANAAYATLSLDVAFQMVEVRTGQGLKPLYRGAQPLGTMEAVTEEVRSVLEMARGPEGDRKRRNAQAMRQKWKKEWEEGGSALRNLRKLLNDSCSCT